MKLVTLRKRREFLRVRGGGRWSRPAFVLEAKRREMAPWGAAASGGSADSAARFGFTVTKRLGNAVQRNRIRRRLKAALSDIANAAANDHFDYVLIARLPARDMAFLDLKKELSDAFNRVHRPPRAQDQRHRRRKTGPNPKA